MSQPTLEIIPLRHAVRSDAPSTIDVLLRIAAPATELNAPRPRVNLGLVIGRLLDAVGGPLHRLAANAFWKAATPEPGSILKPLSSNTSSKALIAPSTSNESV